MKKRTLAVSARKIKRTKARNKHEKLKNTALSYEERAQSYRV